MQKKVLVLNGSYSEIPLIKMINKLGYYSIVLGRNKDALGNNIANKYISCDYSDKDAVLSIAQKENVSAIVSGCNDFSILTTCYIGEKLKLKGHDPYSISKIIHLKDNLRILMKSLGIKSPNIIRYKNDIPIDLIAQKLSFPLIVKPVDLTTGYGMTKCMKIEELYPAIKLAMKETRKDYILIEEFIEGSNHGFSSFIQDQKVTFYFVDNEQHDINEYAVSGASTTHDVSKTAIEQLIKDIEKIAKYLNLVDGLVHVQFILDSNNEPIILEITRRTPGDLYVNLVELATGIKYSEFIVKSEMGLPIQKLEYKEPQNNIVRHCIMSSSNGIIKSVNIDKKIASRIKHSMEWWQKGDIITNYRQYKAGINFIYFDTEQEMNRVLPNLTELISIVLENKDETI